MPTNIDMAIEILHKTRDGEDLDPKHLAVVELAVNDQLNDKGQDFFNGLYAAVQAGNYQKPWFHGIENLTIDNQGYVRYKGQQVEHYSPFSWAYSEQAKKDAEEVARRCQILEAAGVRLGMDTVIFAWTESKPGALVPASE